MERLGVAGIGLVMMVGLCGLPRGGPDAGWMVSHRTPVLPIHDCPLWRTAGNVCAREHRLPNILDPAGMRPAPATVVPNPAVSVSYASPAGCEPVASYPPSVTYMPVASRYPAPTVVYMPVAARYPASPYAGYAPVAGGYPVPATPAGRKVWVHPKVYVEGQPIRNLLKAITP
jgi:hypothetical protein